MAYRSPLSVPPKCTVVSIVNELIIVDLNLRFRKFMMLIKLGGSSDSEYNVTGGLKGFKFPQRSTRVRSGRSKEQESNLGAVLPTGAEALITQRFLLSTMILTNLLLRRPELNFSFLYSFSSMRFRAIGDCFHMILVLH